jgi:hypothetical protein
VQEKATVQESKIETIKTKVDSRPGRYYAEIKDDSIKGESVYNLTLGIFTSGDYPGVKENIQAFNLTKPSIHSLNSCANAIDRSGADGIYVTEIKEEQSGMFPFYYTVKVTVRGKPIYFKNISTTPIEKTDFNENLKIDMLDDEIGILKASIEKEISKQIKIGEYKLPSYTNTQTKQGDKK